MRFLGVVLAGACILGLSCGSVRAQDARALEPRVPAYATHHDARHGHNHSYPDRGAVFRELPSGSITVNYAGISYRFHEAVWFEPQGPAFLVVAPPIGLVVPTLPAFATTVASGSMTYLYANSVYYRPRTDLGGYEVVNDPEDAAGAAPATDPSGTAQPADEAPPIVTPAPPALAVATAPAPVAPPAPEPPPAPAAGASPASDQLTPVAAPAPRAVSAPVASQPPPAPAPLPHGLKVVAAANNGQSAEQQARDHYECYRFATVQSGFDPMRATTGASSAEQQLNYDRAQAACFEGRGYTLR